MFPLISSYPFVAGAGRLLSSALRSSTSIQPTGIISSGCDALQTYSAPSVWERLPESLYVDEIIVYLAIEDVMCLRRVCTLPSCNCQYTTILMKWVDE